MCAAAVAVGVPGRTDEADPLLGPERHLLRRTDGIRVLHQQDEPDPPFRVESSRIVPALDHSAEPPPRRHELELRARRRPAAVDVEVGERLLVSFLGRRIAQLARVGLRPRNSLHGREDHRHSRRQPVGEPEHADPVRIVVARLRLGLANRARRRQVVASARERVHRQVLVTVDDDERVGRSHRAFETQILRLMGIAMREHDRPGASASVFRTGQDAPLVCGRCRAPSRRRRARPD
jgi:hypothetical protein